MHTCDKALTNELAYVSDNKTGMTVDEKKLERGEEEEDFAFFSC